MYVFALIYIYVYVYVYACDLLIFVECNLG